MKMKCVSVALAAALALLLSACSSGEVTSVDIGMAASPAPGVELASQEATEDGANSASASPGTQESGVVVGKVENIVGNEVTLELAETPSGMTAESITSDAAAATGSGSGGTSPGATPSGEMPSGEMPSGEMPSGEAPSGEMPSGEMPSGEAPSGEMPSGEAPSGEATSGEATSGEATSGGDASGGDASGGNASGGDASGGSDTTEYEYTGETGKYLLPVGMAIGSGDFSAVSEGMVLALVLDASGAITAVSILSR